MKRKRGRPTTIDTDAAMRAVVELFRSKGYAAVSLDELSDVTGLSRPSLYRAFGNKLSMYINALDAFGAQAAETALPALQADGDLALALTNFFDEMLAIYYRDADIAPGCLVFGTAPSSADEMAIQSRLAFGIEQVDHLMRARMLRAFPESEASTLDAAVAIASNTLIAFSARAKSGATKTELASMGAGSARSVSMLLSSRGGAT
ncbi:MAG: TetR/AcrR family transcriptional regulator [Pseudomonadota bacterium]